MDGPAAEHVDRTIGTSEPHGSRHLAQLVEPRERLHGPGVPEWRRGQPKSLRGNRPRFLGAAATDRGIGDCQRGTVSQGRDERDTRVAIAPGAAPQARAALAEIKQLREIAGIAA